MPCCTVYAFAEVNIIYITRHKLLTRICYYSCRLYWGTIGVKTTVQCAASEAVELSAINIPAEDVRYFGSPTSVKNHEEAIN